MKREYRLNPQGQYTGLNDEQTLLYEAVIKHHQRILDGQKPAPLFITVDGRGGTGKSKVIGTMSAHLESSAIKSGGTKTTTVPLLEDASLC